MSNIGVLQEQGDLGLGFDPITDQKELDQVRKELEESTSDANREKKD